MKRILLKHPDPQGGAAGALSLMAFIMCIAMGMFATAMPYVIMRLGGSDFAVGMSSGTGFLSYILGCILIQKRVDRHNPRILALTAIGMFVVIYLLIAWISTASPFGGAGINLAFVIVLLFVQGFATSILWPPIMGWMSSGAEGAILNQRLAVYNVSWTSGLTIGPFIAGKICEIDPPFAVLISAAMVFTAGLIIFSLKHEGSLEASGGPDEGVNGFEYDDRLEIFKRIAKPTMIFIFFGAAALKTQMAVLYEKELGFSETNYGITVAVFHLANALTFFVFTRTNRWHYQFWLHFAVQIAAMVAMGLVAVTGSLFGLLGLVMVAGSAQAYAYMGNQYYSVSGASRRARQMAIHEILLAIGCGLGPVIAGAAALYGSRRLGPYLLAAGVVAISILVQAIYVLKGRGKARRSGQV